MQPPIDASASGPWPDPPCRLPARQRQAHKGSFGRALIIGGSRGMSGAVALAGMASVSGGAGLTTLAVPDRILDTVAGFCPAYMLHGLADDADGAISEQAIRQVIELSSGVTAFGLGPGLGTGTQVRQVAAQLYVDLSVVGVVDADGLNALGQLSLKAWARPAAARILTPHPGEFERLSGVSARHRPEQITAAGRSATGRGGAEGSPDGRHASRRRELGQPDGNTRSGHRRIRGRADGVDHRPALPRARTLGGSLSGSLCAWVGGGSGAVGSRRPGPAATAADRMAAGRVAASDRATASATVSRHAA